MAWVLENRPIRLPGAAAIFTAASSGIPLGLMHHLRHNRVLHERVLLLSTVSTDAPRIDPAERVTLVPVAPFISDLWIFAVHQGSAQKGSASRRPEVS